MTDQAANLRRAKVAIPIRVRGMSTDNKFFDEATETLYVSASSIIARLQNCTDPDSEVHVTSKVTRQGGSFRVVWVNTQESDGAFATGLEVLDVEGNIWGKSLDKVKEYADGTVAQATLQCRRCKTSQTAAVPEALEEFIAEGFTIARHCEKCKGSTRWAIPKQGEEAQAARARDTEGREDRRKGRAAIKMKIKVFCDRLGILGEDVCETINVSANGLYFRSQNPYAVGEALRIIAPYVQGAVAIPVAARVVRLDRPKDSSLLAVAVEMKGREKAGKERSADGPA